jgi:hypothetical protein
LFAAAAAAYYRYIFGPAFALPPPQPRALHSNQRDSTTAAAAAATATAVNTMCEKAEYYEPCCSTLPLRVAGMIIRFVKLTCFISLWFSKNKYSKLWPFLAMHPLGNVSDMFAAIAVMAPFQHPRLSYVSTCSRST